MHQWCACKYIYAKETEVAVTGDLSSSGVFYWSPVLLSTCYSIVPWFRLVSCPVYRTCVYCETAVVLWSLVRRTAVACHCMVACLHGFECVLGHAMWDIRWEVNCAAAVFLPGLVNEHFSRVSWMFVLHGRCISLWSWLQITFISCLTNGEKQACIGSWWVHHCLLALKALVVAWCFGRSVVLFCHWRSLMMTPLARVETGLVC